MNNRRWICSDVWLNILPFFDRPKLGLNLALLSYRFDALVDKHFDGKSELALWECIIISKDKRPNAKLCVLWKHAEFPFPDRPLPNKIRFKSIHIDYIDHSVISFLRSNQQIWDMGTTKLSLNVWSQKKDAQQPIWDVFVHEIWPIFATNIRHLSFTDGDHLDNLRGRTSPTILTDLNINSINSGRLCPVGIADDDLDGPNAACAGQALSKWIHTPRKDGQPKRLRCHDTLYRPKLEWITNFRETFPRAIASVSYEIHFNVCVSRPSIQPYELVNEQTKERLTLMKKEDTYWLLKRCPIIGETAATVQCENDENADNNMNNVFFGFTVFENPTWQVPLSPSNENLFSSLAGPSSDQAEWMNELFDI